MKQHNDTIVNPIYDWLDSDVWEYIKQENIKVNPLYEQGYKRIGCIGCPLSSYTEKIKDFNKYPAYETNYIKAFERMLIEIKKKKGNIKLKWENGQDVFDWWIEKYKHEIKGQMSIEDYLNNETT